MEPEAAYPQRTMTGGRFRAAAVRWKTGDGDGDGDGDWLTDSFFWCPLRGSLEMLVLVVAVVAVVIVVVDVVVVVVVVVAAAVVVEERTAAAMVCKLMKFLSSRCSTSASAPAVVLAVAISDNLTHQALRNSFCESLRIIFR